jgi:hypothetical protein
MSRLARPITSRFSRRVTEPLVIAPSIAVQSQVAQAALIGKSASLSGRIEDNRPGLGVPARDAVAGQCVSPDGVNDYATVGDLGTIRALSFFVCPTDVTSNTDGLITLNGTQSVSLVDGVITAAGLSATIRQSATPTVGEFVLVSVDLGEAVSASAVEFFRVGANYSSSKMSDIRFYTDSLSESEHDQLATLSEDACANKPSAGHFKLDSVSTTHLLNSRGDQHATLNLHTHLSFRYVDEDAPVDYLNNKGYTLSDGATQYLNDDGTGLIPAGVYIPRLESDKTKCIAYDVDGNRLPLQYPGKAHKPMQLVDANCFTFDGVDDKISLDLSALSKANNHSGQIRFKAGKTVTSTLFAHTSASDNRFLATFESNVLEIGCYNGSSYAAKSVTFTDTADWHVLEWEYDSSGHTLTATLDGVAMTGTSAPSASATVGSFIGSLSSSANYFQGSLCDFYVAVDGVATDWLPCSEGAGDIAHNVADPANNGDISGHTESTFYGTKQDVFHYNSNKGWSSNQLYDADFSEATLVPGVDSNFGKTWRLDQDANPVIGGTDFDVQFETLGSLPSTTAAWIASQQLPFVNGRPITIKCQAKRVSGTNSLRFGREYFTDVSHFFTTSDWEDVELTMVPNVTGNHELIIGSNGSGSTIQLRNLHVTWQEASPIPAKSDGSGLDCNNNPLDYPPYTDKHTISESKVNMHPVAWPTRDWSLPVNLVESNLENWSLQSQTLDRGIEAPDGNYTAFRVNNLHQTDPDLGITRTVAAIASQTYAGSFWVKGEGADIGKNINLRLKRGAGAGALALLDTNFELSAEWQRVEHSMTLNSDNTHIITGISGAAATNKASSVLIWNPQLELGSQAGATVPYGFQDETPLTDFHPDPPELLEYNSEFDNAYWTKAACNATANSDGIADKIHEDSSDTVHTFKSGNEPAVSGKQYILSIEVKDVERDHILMFPDSTSGTQGGQWFDIGNGNLGSSFSVGVDTAWIEDLGDGYYSCNIVVTAGKSTIANRIYIGNGEDNNYLGDGSSGLLFRNAKTKRYFPTNPLFHRNHTIDGRIVAVDRITDYKQPLVGTRLAQAQQFTQSAGV